MRKKQFTLNRLAV